MIDAKSAKKSDLGKFINTGYDTINALMFEKNSKFN